MESSATIRLPRRAVSAPMSEKARARMIRQEILEHEQHVEDLEALRITPDELKTLRESFAAVKAEFVDLDGQSWETTTARKMLIDWNTSAIPPTFTWKEWSCETIAVRYWRSSRLPPSWRQKLAETVQLKLVDLQHARQAMRERPVPLSPGGLRMRRHQPRRSLSSVVSPASSPQSKTIVKDEDVFSDETVRARPAKTTSARPMVLPTVDSDDDEDPNDITLQAPPDLSTLTALVSSSSQPQEFSATTSSTSTPVFTFARSDSLPSAARNACNDVPEKTVLTSSPTLNQGTSFFDADTCRAGPEDDLDDVPMARPQSRMGWNSSCED